MQLDLAIDELDSARFSRQILLPDLDTQVGFEKGLREERLKTLTC